MTSIPRPALWLGLLGLIPFLYGAGEMLGVWPAPVPELAGAGVLRAYGIIILAYMGGCLWGFAAAGGRSPEWRDLAVAVIPALWGLSASFHPAPLGLLAAGFVVLVALDLIFLLWGLVPLWWLALRLPLSAVVILCLALGAFA